MGRCTTAKLNSIVLSQAGVTSIAYTSSHTSSSDPYIYAHLDMSAYLHLPVQTSTMVCRTCSTESFAWLAEIFVCPVCGDDDYVFPIFATESNYWQSPVRERESEGKVDAEEAGTGSLGCTCETEASGRKRKRTSTSDSSSSE